MRRTGIFGFMATVAVITVASSLPADAARHRHAHPNPSRVIQCVAFARADSDITLPGNAVNWWRNADGVYARGTSPEAGSVLNFRANRRMRLGHVAVVNRILDSRTIQIDQSHWHANGISRDVTVIDVSPSNDWSAVRVAVGRGGAFGSIYPTFGFIYPRPDASGRIITARSDAALPATSNPAPSDLRARASEVAEAPDTAATVSLAPRLLSDDAPNRGLR